MLNSPNYGQFEPFYDEGVRAADLVCAVKASAVIAYSDLIAVGLTSQLAACGLGVGRDISIIGIDDSWLAQMSSPPLTSVNQPVEETGRTAVRMLVDGSSKPAGTAEPRIITLPSRLVLRASLGLGPPSADNLTATGGGARNTAF